MSVHRPRDAALALFAALAALLLLPGIAFASIVALAVTALCLSSLLLDRLRSRRYPRR